MKSSWKEKLNNPKDLPKVVRLNEKGQKHWHGEMMVVPAPMEVYEIMAKVPKGKLITTDGIRKRLAKAHKTDIACPLTTGIFAWIAANASEEMNKTEGKKLIPYWRTLKTGGEINPKFPLDIEGQKNLLRQEGFDFETKGKRVLVKDCEKYIWE